VIGGRAVMALPTRDNFFHTLSVGLDYKHFDQTVKLGTDGFSSPVTYYPMVGSYSATYRTDNFTTQFNLSATSNIGALSSKSVAFDNKRFYASPSFTHFNADVSHTQELWKGFQLWGKVQGQLADGPLVSSEQISVGGLDTVRGYYESEVLGDNGVVGNLELRSPDVGSMLQSRMKDAAGGAPAFTTFNEWTFFAFADAGRAMVLHPLPEQQSRFDVWSYGVGTRFKALNYVNGSLAYSVPMISQTYTRAHNPRISFRIWGEF
jgi:hemolysin activation/secretion protein